MTSLSRTSASRDFLNAQLVTPVNARVPSETVTAAKKLAEKAGKSMSDFVRESMENEVSRLSLCPPPKQASLEDLQMKLSDLQELIARLDGRSRLQTEQLLAIGQAIGLKPI